MGGKKGGTGGGGIISRMGGKLGGGFWAGRGWDMGSGTSEAPRLDTYRGQALARQWHCVSNLPGKIKNVLLRGFWKRAGDWGGESLIGASINGLQKGVSGCPNGGGMHSAIMTLMPKTSPEAGTHTEEEGGGCSSVLMEKFKREERILEKRRSKRNKGDERRNETGTRGTGKRELKKNMMLRKREDGEQGRKTVKACYEGHKQKGKEDRYEG